MSVIDTSTDLGRRVQQRLANEHIIWFTTVGNSSGTPQPNPVWFLPTGEDEILIYSLKNAARIQNIETHPEVSLHFNSTPEGGDIAIFTGHARYDSGAPGPRDNADYLGKYGEGITTLGMTPDSFTETYGSAIRVRLTKLRGF